MADTPSIPLNTHKRRCRYCGNEVIEAVKSSGAVIRFDAAPSRAFEWRIGTGGVAAYLGENPVGLAPDELLFREHPALGKCRTTPSNGEG